MAQYRGVDQKDISDSLRRMQTFVRDLNLGPAAEELLNEWQVMTGAPPEIFLYAQDDEELVTFVEQTSSVDYVTRFSRVITHHALEEAADGKDGGVLKLYKDLTAWGALDGNPDSFATRAEREIDCYLMKRNALRLSGADFAPGSAAYERLDEFLRGARGLFEEGRTLDNVQTSVSAMVWLYSTGDDEAAHALYESQELADRAMCRAALQVMTGLDEYAGALRTASPFRRYSVANDVKFEDAGADMAGILFSLREKVGAVLAPYRKKGEVRQTSAGLSADGDGLRVEYDFVATAEAAQAVADALPEFSVMDDDGQRVRPRRPPPGPSFGFDNFGL